MNGSLAAGREIGDYRLDYLIDEGINSSIWKATHLITKTDVAIKAFMYPSADQEAQHAFMTELSIMRSLNHPFIATYYDSMQTYSLSMIVMEYLEQSSLLEVIRINRKVSEAMANRYIVQLVSVLEYLHKTKKIAHRDIKCENILIDKHQNIRVVDFGMSCKCDNLMKTSCGSIGYVAPEILQGKKYNEKVDIWSLGIILFMLVTGYRPFDDDNQTKCIQKILYSSPRFPSSVSADLSDLIMKMLAKDPEDRISIDEIKEHKWFKESGYTVDIYMKFFNDYIDSDVVQKCTNFGIKEEEIVSALQSTDSLRASTIYRMFQRERELQMIVPSDYIFYDEALYDRSTSVNPFEIKKTRRVSLDPSHCLSIAITSPKVKVNVMTSPVPIKKKQRIKYVNYNSNKKTLHSSILEQRKI